MLSAGNLFVLLEESKVFNKLLGINDSRNKVLWINKSDNVHLHIVSMKDARQMFDLLLERGWENNNYQMSVVLAKALKIFDITVVGEVFVKELGVLRSWNDSVNIGIVFKGEGMVLSAFEYYGETVILCPTSFRTLKFLHNALFGVDEYKAIVNALEEHAGNNSWGGKEQFMATVYGSLEEDHRLLPHYCNQIKWTTSGNKASIYGKDVDKSSDSSIYCFTVQGTGHQFTFFRTFHQQQFHSIHVVTRHHFIPSNHGKFKCILTGHISLRNSNSLATMDVVIAFIGNSSYSTLISGVLMFMITYASPIFALFSLMIYVCATTVCDYVGVAVVTVTGLYTCMVFILQKKHPSLAAKGAATEEMNIDHSHLAFLEEKVSRTAFQQTSFQARLHPGSSTPLCWVCPISSAPNLICTPFKIAVFLHPKFLTPQVKSEATTGATYDQQLFIQNSSPKARNKAKVNEEHVNCGVEHLTKFEELKAAMITKNLELLLFETSLLTSRFNLDLAWSIQLSEFREGLFRGNTSYIYHLLYYTKDGLFITGILRHMKPILQAQATEQQVFGSVLEFMLINCRKFLVQFMFPKLSGEEFENYLSLADKWRSDYEFRHILDCHTALVAVQFCEDMWSRLVEVNTCSSRFIFMIAWISKLVCHRGKVKGIGTLLCVIGALMNSIWQRIVSGACISFNNWAIKKRGPVLVMMCSPTILSVIFSVIIVGDTVSLGSLTGISLMFTGLVFANPAGMSSMLSLLQILRTRFLRGVECHGTTLEEKAFQPLIILEYQRLR